MPGALELLPVCRSLPERAEQVSCTPLPGAVPGMLLSFAMTARRLNGVPDALLRPLTVPWHGAG